MTNLQVGGFTPLSTQDYPGELSAVVFCQGCPWRCRYCQNPELVTRNAEPAYHWRDILSFLERRRCLLDAVVFSGGEPTLQSSLGDAMNDVRNLGFKVGLHTAGCYPERLDAVLPLADWVGLDIKELPADYQHITTSQTSGASAWESLDVLLNSGVAYEVRITVHSELTSDTSLQALIDALSAKGIRSMAMQTCRSTDCLDPELNPSRDQVVQRMMYQVAAPGIMMR